MVSRVSVVLVNGWMSKSYEGLKISTDMYRIFTVCMQVTMYVVSNANSSANKRFNTYDLQYITIHMYCNI